VQDIAVRNNVFEERSRENCVNIPGAIYLNGCMNIDVSDNQFSSNVTDAIVAKNCKGLSGSDVSNKI
jgi:hypothetical protein